MAIYFNFKNSDLGSFIVTDQAVEIINMSLYTYTY